MLASEAFVTATKEKLGVKVEGRKVPASYMGILGHENKGLRLENTYSRVAWSDPPKPKPSRNYKLAITLSREYLLFLMS